MLTIRRFRGLTKMTHIQNPPAVPGTRNHDSLSSDPANIHGQASQHAEAQT